MPAAMPAAFSANSPRDPRASPGAAAPYAYAYPSPWRLPPPTPQGDRLDSPWVRGLLGLLALGLLLAFCKVVSDGVQRGERLRSQFTSGLLNCDSRSASIDTAACAVPAADASPSSAGAEPTAARAGTLLLAARAGRS